MQLAVDQKKNSVSRLLMYLLLLFVALPLLTSCESRRTIVNSLDEKEANEILVFLSDKGIDANKTQAKETGGGGAKVVLWDVTVPEDRATEAMSLLNTAGLPRRRGQNLLGIFGSVGLVPSEMQEKIRYQAGLAEQIASTIRKIDGVLDAEVQISFPEEDPLNPGKTLKPIVASVYVKHNGVLDDPNTHLVTKIKRLVSASVAGLDFDNVTVIGDRARFSETPAGGYQGSEEEKKFVTLWSIVIAQDSVTRFRIIFFSFTLAILGLLLSLLWGAWKVYPLLKEHGGIQYLFHMKPAALPKKEKAASSEEVKGKGEKKSDAEKPGQIDRDVDET